MTVTKVTMAENYLTLADDATDDEIRSCYLALKGIGASLGWWIGDFLCAVERLRGTERLSVAMGEWQVSESAASRALKVCRLIPREQRVAGASFSHHATAIEEAMSVDAAIAWTRRAAAEGMSVSDLRVAIRASIRPALPAPNRPTMYEPIYRATAAIRKIDLATIPESDRETLRQDTEEIYQWLGRLHG